ncbi:hypothetical protein LCGC14_1351170 [marine sediment metagenome]|uniref:Uncharacterized protein n=1 Tax=marine sediment metagenome TaxID=412755 RepID=A0A0F9KAY3_9ZZZZ
MEENTQEQNGGEERGLTPIAENHLVLQGDPATQLAFAHKASRALMDIVSRKKKPVIINNEQYLEFEDWQTIARFYGASVGTEWTRPIKDDAGKVIGYEAKAVVHMAGEIISAAEAMTMYAEKNWAYRDEFMLRSMAQTRASAKALRNGFAWVAVLAGYKPTPAEEMPREGFATKPAANAAPAPLQARPAHPAAPARDPNPEIPTIESDPPSQQGSPAAASSAPATSSGLQCVDCGDGISERVRDYSDQNYGRPLCYKCQRK